ncbi:MAG: hypothetical protein HKN74_13200 [Acidimicrobiia bacterium]|nr:hypothetical protein [Acidimicrobiia bacterium]MBT8216556.1 hypothetical protein [Acidimicrobiia bacterium]NNF11230.1 hypothetical protein [Acidimicrobiia bacterium]NNL68966.1 hypothetical protein [Acidimicrobiia bacterium]
MEAVVTVAVDVPLIGDERRKNWAKVVEHVDTDKATGWAYHGEFVSTGGIQDVGAPCVLLVYGERGSKANPQMEARAYLVSTDGSLSLRASASGRAWARTLRDEIVELLEADAPLPLAAREWGPELMEYSDDALRTELKRREAT